MIKWFRAIFILPLAGLVLIGLSACGSLQTAGNYTLVETEGLVVFSISQSGLLQSSLKLQYESLKDGKKLSAALQLAENIDFGEAEARDAGQQRGYDEPVGKLVVFRLPEGIYKLSGWSGTANRLKLVKSSLPQKLDRKFRVANGKILYLGNFHQVSSETHTRLILQDYRTRDLKLFSQYYPRVDMKQLLVASKLFLNTEDNRQPLFSSYTECQFEEGPQLVSKRRLPNGAEPFRSIKIDDKERKISRIDGFRLRYAYPDQLPMLMIKTELSAGRDYASDQAVVYDWFKHSAAKVEQFTFDGPEDDYFKAVVLNTGVLDEKRMLQMTVLFDDANQIISYLTFINPREYLRPYEDIAGFNQLRQRLIEQYKNCVLGKLNAVVGDK